MNLPFFYGIFQPLNQTNLLVILNAMLVNSNQKMPIFARVFLLQTSQPNLGKPI